MKCSNSFQKEEAATEVTILQLQGGGLQKVKKWKMVQRDGKINLLKDELTDSNRSTDLYISVIYTVVSFLDIVFQIRWLFTINSLSLSCH